MNIAAVLGSPRKGGNSEALAEAFLEEAEGLGAKVTRFRLRGMAYQGCRGCYSCKTKSERCVVKDDLTGVLEAMAEADTVLFATPVYFLDLPAQAKALLDRCFAFFKPGDLEHADPKRLSPGKDFVFVVTQGAPERYFVDFVQRYDFVFRILGFKSTHLIRGCNLGEGRDEALGREDLLEAARAAARRVLAGEPSASEIPPYALPGKSSAT